MINHSNFISDYSSIVYSMKLRDTVKQGVQVMSAQKEINYALSSSTLISVFEKNTRLPFAIFW